MTFGNYICLARKTALAVAFMIYTTVSGCSVTDDAGVDGTLVRDQESFREAVRNAVPGDTIVLANGVWEDFEIRFHAIGTENAPVTLTAETKGEVIISGESNLRLSGEYVVVSGLVFKHGHSPSGEIVAFRTDSKTLANDSRVTEIVIDNFNKPDRYETDMWVALFGKNNRFDHNHIEGKKNKGVTLAVRLDDERSQENGHSIDHNYFGPRPMLGSNGGETLRVGTSHHSLTDSKTVIANNFFDRCSGEVEIVSIKSGSNVVRDNVIWESRGAFVLRHGNGNLVENNVFLGNSVANTGGVRVINADQVVSNNYFQGLTGYRFGSALVVMNGVPNSPINRYHQVERARIENNSFIDSINIQLAAGADEERSAAPVDSVIANNIFYSEGGRGSFTVYDDISGIKFSNNISEGIDTADIDGVAARDIQLSKADNGLFYPSDKDLVDVGVSRDLSPIAREDTGVDWYAKAGPDERFGMGAVISVEPGFNTLADALKTTEAGDILELGEGEYIVDKLLTVEHGVTVRAAEGLGKKPLLTYERTSLFEIADGGNLKLQGLRISGERADDSAGNSLIRTSKYSMLDNYQLFIEDCDIVDLNVNHSFNVFTAAKSTFADEIVIRNSTFSNITGHVLDLNKEMDDLGIYNAEYVAIVDSSFDDIEGAVANIYRGGTDESTFGPHFQLSDSTISNVGHGSRNKPDASVYLHGAQLITIDGNTFTNSAPLISEHRVGEPRTRILQNRFQGTPKPVIDDEDAVFENNEYSN